MTGINLQLVLGTREFLKSSKDAGEALGKVGDEFTELARDSERTGRDIEKDLRDTATAGERATEKLERSFEEAFEAGRKESFSASRDMTRNIRRSMDDGVDATQEFKQEFKQNVAEVASSFQGDMDSAVDVVQGTLGGLSAAFGPVGFAIAGLGAAVGSMYANWRKESEQTRDQVNTMFEDMAESGLNFVSGELIRENMDKIIKSQEDAIMSYKELQEAARVAGVSDAEMLRAVAGDMEARGRVIDAVSGKLDALKEKSKPLVEAHDYAGLQSIADELKPLQDLQKELEGLNENYDNSVSQTKLLREAMAGLNIEVTKTLDELSQEQEFRIKVTADATHLRRQVQGILDDTRFNAYVQARNAQGRVVN